MLTTTRQNELLADYHDRFEKIAGLENGLGALSIKTFQINVGRWCNQACKHCHVDASPAREEDMSQEIAGRCIQIIESMPRVETVDITGGAPEGSKVFKYLVEESKRLGKHVIDRCNLTILEEPGFEYLYDFLSSNEVEIIASLPHYASSRTDMQRGTGVFDKSMIALKKLNDLGYGERLPLNLVYNPVGLFLSSPQEQLEREFKENLDRNYGIKFNNLYVINNMPISRYLEALMRKDRFEDYMQLLVSAYNPATVEGLMCRHQLSVGYDGAIYDCDFNQMLDLKAAPVAHVNDFDENLLVNRNIVMGNHCFGCTAGAGSSCGGEIS